MADHVLTSILRNVGLLAPLVRAHVAEADALARLPDPVVQALIDAGLFRLWLPKSCGGFELSLVGGLKVCEAVATQDGSVGWSVMIGSGGGLFAAYLNPDVAREMFAAPTSVIAGSGAPLGRAERVRDGYIVNGRWSYASGAHYATTFTANCVLTENGVEMQSDDGGPRIRAMSFDPSQVEILPTWDPHGMRGTGSHDFVVKDAFVPEQRTFSVITDAPCEPGTLYRLPFGVLTELPITAVAIGIARHALDAFGDLAREKRTHSGATLASDPTVQAQFARSHARWCAEQASLYAAAAGIWHVTVLGRAPNVRELAEITARCAVGVSELQRLVADLASLAGMNAVAGGDEFARASRDLQTLAAHMAVSPTSLAPSGAALLQRSP